MRIIGKIGLTKIIEVGKSMEKKKKIISGEMILVAESNSFGDKFFLVIKHGIFGDDIK